MPFGSTTTRGNRAGSLRTQVGEYVDAAFLNAPNHSSTRRSSFVRASSSMMSTSEKSKVPSTGSLSAQLTGESTTLEPTRRTCANESAIAFGDDEAELNTWPPTSSAGSPSRRSANGASVERVHGRAAAMTVLGHGVLFLTSVCGRDAGSESARLSQRQRAVAEVAEPRLAVAGRVERGAQAQQVARRC